jgi:hypothetical protein
MKKVFVFTIIAAIVCTPMAFVEGNLGSEEIKSLFTNSSTNAYNNLKDAPVSLYYDGNGEVRGIFSTGKKGLTKWWVKDNDQICLKGKDGDLCFIVVEKNGKYEKHLVKDDGTLILAFSMEEFTKGNINDY